MNNSLLEALKEPARLIALAIVSWLLTEGVGLAMTAFGAKLDDTTKLLITGILTSALRGLDKYLHEIGKDSGDENMAKGLVRF